MIIFCENINKYYNKTQVLCNANLQINQGETIAITGPSGCGKSTLLNILAGIDKINSGTIKVFMQDLNNLNEKQLSKFRAKNIGFIYQFHYLLTDFTAAENIQIPLLIKGTSKKQAKQQSIDILNSIGLKDCIDKFTNQLSGGQRQRIAIARAIITKPKLILADEPTGSLDDENSKKALNLLLDLQKQNNSTLIIATHDNQIAKQMDKSLTIINNSIQIN